MFIPKNHTRSMGYWIWKE